MACTNVSIHASKSFGIKGGWTDHQKEGMVQERGVKVVTPYVYKVLDPERCGTHTLLQINVHYVLHICSYEKKSGETRD